MANSHKLVETLFREEHGKITAILTNKYGISTLEMIEDAVQEALIKAMQVWGYQQQPKNPTAWLLKVANNKLVDELRKQQKLIAEHSDQILVNKDFETRLEDEIYDDQLRLIFACCHPKISIEYQLVLSLKLIGGFGNGEVAKVLLKKEDAVAKSFTRAKQKLAKHVSNLNLPIEMGLRSRLAVVLKVIYLIFTEGYTPHKETGMRKDFCYEAIRLALLLTNNKYCNHGNVHALIALMCFHTARFEARFNSDNELVTLENQDRSKYNQDLIQIGIFHLENAATEDKTPSSYHLQAAVSYFHSIAKSYTETDWKEILYLYDLQLVRFYSPVIALNRIIPLSKVQGLEKGLQGLKVLETQFDYSKSAQFFGTKASLLQQLRQTQKAQTAYNRAMKLTKNDMERNHFRKQLKQCN